MDTVLLVVDFQARKLQERVIIDNTLTPAEFGMKIAEKDNLVKKRGRPKKIS